WPVATKKRYKACVDKTSDYQGNAAPKHYILLSTLKAGIAAAYQVQIHPETLGLPLARHSPLKLQHDKQSDVSHIARNKIFTSVGLVAQTDALIYAEACLLGMRQDEPWQKPAAADEAHLVSSAAPKIDTIITQQSRLGCIIATTSKWRRSRPRSAATHSTKDDQVCCKMCLHSPLLGTANTTAQFHAKATSEVQM
ncbi:hypothetical protein IAQ61_010580, partial [Plenodomus lingam]